MNSRIKLYVEGNKIVLRGLMKTKDGRYLEADTLLEAFNEQELEDAKEYLRRKEVLN